MELSKIAVYVMEYRDRVTNPILSEWLAGWEKKGVGIFKSSKEYGIPLARNDNCENFMENLVPQGFEYIVMFDVDMVPVQEAEPNATANIFTAPGDVVYCGYVDRGGRPSHFGNDQFGAGCMRLSAAALQKMTLPWFQFFTNAKNSRRLRCECHWVRDKAIEAGYDPKMVGIVGHILPFVVIPDLAQSNGMSARLFNG